MGGATRLEARLVEIIDNGVNNRALFGSTIWPTGYVLLHGAKAGRTQYTNCQSTIQRTLARNLLASALSLDITDAARSMAA